MSNKSEMETERQNIKTSVKAFAYFIVIFSVVLLVVLMLLDTSSDTYEEKLDMQGNLVEVANGLDDELFDNTSLTVTTDEVIHIPGYPGDFVLLTDKNGRRGFSSIRVGYFTDTKVMYSLSSGYAILTLLVNSDGTPMLYDPSKYQQ